MVDYGELHIFHIAQAAFVGFAYFHIINKVQVLEQGGATLRVAVEGAFHHIGTQAKASGEHLYDEAGVAVADGLQDYALDCVVH